MTAIAPEWAARKLDRRHAQLTAEIADLAAEAEWYLTARDLPRARALVAEINRLRGQVERIESCWVPR